MKVRTVLAAAAIAVAALVSASAQANPPPAPSVEEAAAALAQQRPGVRDVYIVAAGLYGDPVFEREALRGAEILTQRFDAAGRVLGLANFADPAGPPHPTATIPNLSSAIAKVGEVMDREEDVLLLFLTSHGDERGVSVRNRSGLDEVLTPTALRASLDAAGAKNRIVIISACHSGTFVKALQTPTTLVMTAASTTRSSFGCTPENEWTYFGDALLNRSLRRGRTLLQAFEEAKAQVTLWEQKERLTPSNPQLFIGAEVKSFLDALPSPALGGAPP
jgi:hypothetical protein